MDPLVVGEPLHDEVTDLGEGHLLVRGIQYGHRDQGDVGVGRLRGAGLRSRPRRARRLRVRLEVLRPFGGIDLLPAAIVILRTVFTPRRVDRKVYGAFFFSSSGCTGRDVVVRRTAGRRPRHIGVLRRKL